MCEENSSLSRNNQNFMEAVSKLHNAICSGEEKIVNNILETYGVEILGQEIPLTIHHESFDQADEYNDYMISYKQFPWNGLDISILLYNADDGEPEHIPYNLNFYPFYEMIREKCLQAFAIYGLNLFHIHCAYGRLDLIEEDLINDFSILNKSIDLSSPLWPGMTPLSIAAKFLKFSCVTVLLQRGALHGGKDSEGNTALHYEFSYIPRYCDKALFDFDNESTFSNTSGMSHFHIACACCPKTMDIVEKYLSKGVSPNICAKANVHDEEFPYAYASGLHICVKMEVDNYDAACKLANLLLENGADVNLKDKFGKIPLDYFAVPFITELMLILIENGSIIRDKFLSELFDVLNDSEDKGKIAFLQCIKRMLMINGASVLNGLQTLYQIFAKKMTEFNEALYAETCAKELALLSQGLFRELQDVHPVLKDFKNLFNSITMALDECYPIYGRLLKNKLKRRLFEYEKKEKLVPKAKPLLLDLMGNVSMAVVIFAEDILWNFHSEELEHFVSVCTK